jgi:hypothetical protein
LAAVVLAVLLWFNVTAGERRDEQVRTRLEFEVADSMWVPIQLPAEVTTIFQGRRSDVQRLFLEAPRIRYMIDSVTAPTMQVSLRPEMVVYDRGLSVRATDVRPSSVELRFERRVTREIQVEPVIEAAPAPGHVIVGEPILDPPTVTVRGIESVVDTVALIHTERLSLQNVTRSETHRLVLQLPADPSRLTVEPRSVQVTIEVDSLLERTLQVPVRVTGRAAGQVRLGQDVVPVRLRGPAQAVRAISVGSLTATVRVDAVPETPVTLTVQLGLPEGSEADVVQSVRVLVSPLPPELEAPDSTADDAQPPPEEGTADRGGGSPSDPSREPGRLT